MSFADVLRKESCLLVDLERSFLTTSSLSFLTVSSSIALKPLAFDPPTKNESVSATIHRATHGNLAMALDC